MLIVFSHDDSQEWCFDNCFISRLVQQCADLVIVKTVDGWIEVNFTRGNNL